MPALSLASSRSSRRHHCKASRQLLRAHWAPSSPRERWLAHHHVAGPFPGLVPSRPQAALSPRALHVLGFLLSTLTVSFPGIIPYSNRRSHPCWGVEVLIAPLRGCSLLTLGKFSGAYLPVSAFSLSLSPFLPSCHTVSTRTWCLTLFAFASFSMYPFVGYSGLPSIVYD